MVRPKLNRNKTLQCMQFARELKNRPTSAEIMMHHILNRVPINFHFQKVFTPYIVDFYIARPTRLIIEVDGKHHSSPFNKIYDAKREKWLKFIHPKMKIIRFDNEVVLTNPEDIERIIRVMVYKRGTV